MAIWTKYKNSKVHNRQAYSLWLAPFKNLFWSESKWIDEASYFDSRVQHGWYNDDNWRFWKTEENSMKNSEKFRKFQKLWKIVKWFGKLSGNFWKTSKTLANTLIGAFVFTCTNYNKFFNRFFNFPANKFYWLFLAQIILAGTESFFSKHVVI